MERKIGDTFEFEGKKLQVKECAYSGCDGCFFDEQHIPCSKNVAGYCGSFFRTDKKKVIFVEAQEQPQKTEAVKERKIGEVFEYQGKKLKVVKTAKDLCFDCYFFDGVNCQRTEQGGGECSKLKRADYKPVIFMEVDKEQQQDKQPQKLNLCEILKYCPTGESFWSPLLGDVKFHDINQKRNFIVVSLESGEIWDINADGTITFGYVTSPEIMLYPSRKQRDWTKVKYEPKKAKFDPKTLKPFDRVLARNHGSHRWACDLFSNIIDGDECMYHCINSYYRYCIPYNDDTKHLVDTKDDAPIFYRYWED